MPSKRLPVAHVVMRIKQGIRALCVRDVIDCVSELAEILGHSQRVTGNVAKKTTNSFIEFAAQARRQGAHAFHKKRNTEEVDFLLVHEYVNGALKTNK